MTLRIKSNNGRLECEYSESEKPNPTDVLYITSWHKFNNELFKITTAAFNNSFKPIQLSVSAEKYLLNEFGSYLYVITPKELSPTECEVFYISQIPMESNAGLGGYILHLKEPVAPELEYRNKISDLAKSLEGVRVDKLENCFAPSTELIEQSQDEVRKEAVKFAEWISDKEYFKSMNEKGEWYVLNYSDNDSENVTKTIANTTEELFTIYKNNG